MFMRRLIWVFAFALLLPFNVEGAGESQKSADTLAAIAKIPDPFVRMTALEECYTRRRLEPDTPDVDRNLLLHLTDTAYQIRRFPAVLRYGEEGLRREWNNPRLKLALYFYVARACEELGVNEAKVLRYTAFIRQLAGVVDPTRADPLIWQRFVAPSLRLAMRLKANRAATSDDWLDTVADGIAALALDANEEVGKELYAMALRARAHEHGGAAAVAALEALCRSSIATTEHLNRLAFWYSRQDRQEQAAALLIASYGRKRDAAVAYTIGKLLQNRRPEEAMDYLAESVQAGNGEVSTRARRLLEHLFFNVHKQDLTPPEREDAFESLLQKAAKRLKQTAATAGEQEIAG